MLDEMQRQGGGHDMEQQAHGLLSLVTGADILRVAAAAESDRGLVSERAEQCSRAWCSAVLGRQGLLKTSFGRSRAPSPR